MEGKDYEAGVLFDADLTGVDFGPGAGPAEPYDKCVYLALGCAWARRGREPFSVSHLTRLMSGLAKASPTAKQRDRANASVGLLSRGTFMGKPILRLSRGPVKFGGLTSEDAITLEEQPLLLSLAEATGNVLEVPMEVYADPLSLHPANLPLRDHVLGRLRDAHLSGERELVMTYEEIYGACGAATVDQRQKAREKAWSLLGYYASCRFVDGATMAGEGYMVDVDPPFGWPLYWKEETDG